MSDARSMADSLGERMSSAMCLDPVIHKLTPKQMAALHMCKHKMLAAVFELYMEVPQATADKLLEKYFKLPQPKPVKA